MAVTRCPVSTDPPRHRQLRSLVTQAFTPRAIEALAPVADLPVRDGQVDGLVFREAASVTTIEGGHATNVVWNFGDGSFATNQLSPAHSFAAPGNFSVTLTAVLPVPKRS